MKKYLVILLSFTLVFMMACKRPGAVYPSQVAGKWNVVTDTSYSVFRITTTTRNYIGKPGDYFDFRSDGKVYINESNVLDTLAYNVVNNNTIQIQTFGWILNGNQEPSSLAYTSDNSAVSITTNVAITPDGFTWRSVSLKR